MIITIIFRCAERCLRVNIIIGTRVRSTVLVLWFLSSLLYSHWRKKCEGRRRRRRGRKTDCVPACMYEHKWSAKQRACEKTTKQPITFTTRDTSIPFIQLSLLLWSNWMTPMCHRMPLRARQRLPEYISTLYDEALSDRSPWLLTWSLTRRKKWQKKSITSIPEHTVDGREKEKPVFDKKHDPEKLFLTLSIPCRSCWLLENERIKLLFLHSSWNEDVWIAKTPRERSTGTHVNKGSRQIAQWHSSCFLFSFTSGSDVPLQSESRERLDWQTLLTGLWIEIRSLERVAQLYQWKSTLCTSLASIGKQAEIICRSWFALIQFDRIEMRELPSTAPSLGKKSLRVFCSLSSVWSILS